MDIGLKHIITADGDLIPANWNTFNPNLAVGGTQEIRIYDFDISIDKIYSELNNNFISQDFTGHFYLGTSNQSFQQFIAEYSVTVNAQDNLQVKTFIFLSDGDPWAICSLGSPIQINANHSVIFDFTSTVAVYNNTSLTSNIWTSDLGEFKLNYSAMVYPVDEYIKKMIISSSPALNQANLADADISSILAAGTEFIPDYVNENGKIGVNIVAKSKNDIKGVKAIFIRLLWNLGIMIYIDSMNTQGVITSGLSMNRGHKLKLVFGVDFQDISQ